MATIDELRVCKSCGNVFSKKAGVTIITECPQCNSTSFEQIEIGPSENEEVYLDELD
ncbi:MAG: DNA repair protein RadA [Nitrosopumilus sp.]|nr:DNA repair protein RadA [Nitrosopumilus sp.]